MWTQLRGLLKCPQNFVLTYEIWRQEGNKQTKVIAWGYFIRSRFFKECVSVHLLRISILLILLIFLAIDKRLTIVN